MKSEAFGGLVLQLSGVCLGSYLLAPNSNTCSSRSPLGYVRNASFEKRIYDRIMIVLIVIQNTSEKYPCNVSVSGGYTGLYD